MKLKYAGGTVVLNAPLEVTYTVEKGDPPSFFFREFVDGGLTQGGLPGGTFTKSGTFTISPGIPAPHVIQAYAAGPIPGIPVGGPFAQGPTFTPVGPGAVSTSQPTSAPTIATTTTPSKSTSAIPPQAVSSTITQPASSTPDTGLSSSTPHSTESSPTTQTSSSGSAHIAAIPEASASAAGLDLSSAVAVTTLYTQSGSVTIAYEVFTTGTSTIIIEETAAPSPSGNTAATSEISKLRSPNKSHAAVIGGSIAGVVLALLLLLFLFLCIRRTRKRRKLRELESQAAESSGQFLSFEAAYLNDKSMQSVNEVARIDPELGFGGYTHMDPKELMALQEKTKELVVQPAYSQMEWVLRPTRDPAPEYNTQVDV